MERGLHEGRISVGESQYRRQLSMLICSDAHILVKFSRCHRDDDGMSLQSHIDDEQGGEVPLPSVVACRDNDMRPTVVWWLSDAHHE